MFCDRYPLWEFKLDNVVGRLSVAADVVYMVSSCFTHVAMKHLISGAAGKSDFSALFVSEMSAHFEFLCKSLLLWAYFQYE